MTSLHHLYINKYLGLGRIRKWFFYGARFLLLRLFYFITRTINFFMTAFTVYQNHNDAMLLSMLNVAEIRALLINAPIVAAWHVTLKNKSCAHRLCTPVNN